MIPRFHPRFKLNGRPVSSVHGLVEMLRPAFPGHAAFVEEWLSEHPRITLHTSGSTGKPKAMVFPKEKLLRHAERTISYFDLPPGSKVLLNLQSSYVAGKMMWVRALAGGWDLHIIPSRGRLELPAGPPFDFGAMVPYQVYHNPGVKDRFRQLILGGAPVDPGFVETVRDWPVVLYLTYGMTETLTHVAVRPLNRAAMRRHELSAPDLYHALPGVSFSVYGENLLAVRDRLTDIGPLQTGDVVDLKDAKSFRWLGRADNVINSGGHKIMPETVESRLRPYISRDFYLTSRPHSLWGEQAVLVIEGRPYKEDWDRLYDRAGLHPYERPKQILFMPTFERTNSGKIIRK